MLPFSFHRDDHVKIHWNNIGDSGGNAKITQQRKDQFEISNSEETTEYDCLSIMHYGSYQGIRTESER